MANKSHFEGIYNAIMKMEGFRPANDLGGSVEAGQFIRTELERFPWAIAAVKTTTTPADMETMVRAIFRDCLIVFLPPDYSPKVPELAEMEEHARRFGRFLTIINWQIFFDRIQGTRRFYTMPEAEKMIGRVRQTIVKWIKEGRLQAQMMGGKWAIPIDSMEGFLDRAWHRPKTREHNDQTKD